MSLFLSINTENRHPNYPASCVVAEAHQLAVFCQTVSLDVVYVSLWMVCSEPGLSWLNIQSSFNLAMRHRMTHGLCISVCVGGGGYINHTPVNSDTSSPSIWAHFRLFLLTGDQA